MENTKPRKAQLNCAIRQLAASLPPTQYTYKGVMSGDDIKDLMKVNRARTGERIERENSYTVNRHHYVNHNRALKKIIGRKQSEKEMQSQILSYIEKAKVDYFAQKEVITITKTSLWQRIVAYITRLLLGIR